MYIYLRIKRSTFLTCFYLAKTNMATNNTDQIQYYTATCGQHTYTLPVRYQDLRPIGQGAFGAVV